MVTHTCHLGRLGSVWRHRLCLQTPSQRNHRCILHQNISFHGATIPSGSGLPYFQGFKITLRHTMLGRTSLYEWPAHCRDLYLTTHNIHKTQKSMLLAGFKPAIPASKQLQTHTLDSAATGIGRQNILTENMVDDNALKNSDDGLWHGSTNFPII